MGMVNIPIQRSNTRSVLTELKDCYPAKTCITANVRPRVGRIPFIADGR